jgi:hypothetical protein
MNKTRSWSRFAISPGYIFVLFLVTLVLRIVLIGYHNNNLGGIEPNVIYGIQRIVLGQPLYQDPASGSYAIMQYTPLYYYLVAGVAKIAGVDGHNVQGIYTLCRMVALIFNLLTIVLAANIIRKWHFSWQHSFAFASPILIMLTSHYYTRGDSMHLFFFLAAVYAYLSYNRKEQFKYILVSAFLSAACIMVKQSGILVIGIIGFCLTFLERKFLFVIGYVTATLISGYLMLALCVHGEWHTFYQNAVLGLKNGTDASFLYLIFISQFFRDLIPCYFLGGIIAYTACTRIADKTYRTLAAGAVLSFSFAVVTGLKIGSSNNYFTEFLLFIILAFPYLWRHEQSEKTLFRIRNYAVSVRGFASVAIFILITSKTAGFFSIVCIERSFKDQRNEYAGEEALLDYFKGRLVIKSGEKIFFTERGFMDNLFIDYALMPNKDVVIQLYRTDTTTYDYSAFVSGMNTGLVKYIITDEKKNDINTYNSSIPFVLFDKSKFKFLGKKSGYCIYVYSPARV